jgi:hypothetical protein
MNGCLQIQQLNAVSAGRHINGRDGIQHLQQRVVLRLGATLAPRRHF